MTNKEGFSYRVIPMERKRRGILASLTTLCAFLAANKIPHIKNGTVLWTKKDENK